MLVVRSQLSVVRKARGARSEERGVCSFPLPPSALRLGISLTEVLIALGILTIGLLGVASVFPVGSWYMHRADVSDTGSALAQAAMNDLQVHGYLDPYAWFSLSPTPTSGVIVEPNYIYPLLESKYSPNGTLRSGTFTRPMAEILAEAIHRGTQNSVLDGQFGNTYVIDPLGAASIAQTPAASNGGGIGNDMMYAFPASAFVAYPGNGWSYYGHMQWNPWRDVNRKYPQKPSQMAWPMRRVTFRGADGWPQSRTVAESLFTNQDQLAYEFPQRDDRPAIARYDISNAGNPTARQWTGDYSWLATVSFSNPSARNNLSLSPSSAQATVSVVAMYKRTMQTGDAVGNTQSAQAAAHERMLSAAVVSRSPSGGEMLLRDVGDGLESAFTNLKTGNWILICGPHPTSTPNEPRFVVNWYQVLSIDKSASGIITDETKQRIVTLRGPEWPWEPSPNGVRDYSDLSNDLCAGVIRAAVAVHTKTIHLENPATMGMASYGKAGTNNPGDPPVAPH